MKEKFWGILWGGEKKAMTWKDIKEGEQSRICRYVVKHTHAARAPSFWTPFTNDASTPCLHVSLLSYHQPPLIPFNGIPLFVFFLHFFLCLFLLSCAPPLSWFGLFLYCTSHFLFLLLLFWLLHSTVCVNIIQESHGCAILIRLAGASLFLVVTPL